MDEYELPTYLPADIVGEEAIRARSIRATRTVVTASTLVFVGLMSLWLALRLTPDQRITAMGQRVQVGITSPTLSLSGPGEMVLFGRTIPTEIDFAGPVRPRLVLEDITIDRQIASSFLRERGVDEAAGVLGSRLASGLRRWVAIELLVLTAVAFAMLGALAGWRRHGWRETVGTILIGLLVAHVVNASALAIAAASAPSKLASIGSLNELVGTDPVTPLGAAVGRTLGGVQAVILGDSTAAGLGGPALEDPSGDDTACKRSSFAFASTLAQVNGWKVKNLACTGATIRWGILGKQRAAGRWLSPQLAVAKRVSDPEVVIVSVGANDLGWSILVGACALADSCDDRAQTAYFQRRLDRFARDYYDLLRELAALPGKPQVIVSQYYVPFSSDEVDCLAGIGLDGDKVEVLVSRLDALNSVLAAGARTFRFATVRPEFEGHGICSPIPYVQGLGGNAPFHPNALGHLALALAYESVAEPMTATTVQNG